MVRYLFTLLFKAGAVMDEVDQRIVEILKVAPSDAKSMQAELRASGHALSQPTLSRRLQALVKDRQVAVEGTGRSTRYVRDPYHDWFSVPPHRRPKVGFRFDLLDAYVPNQTRWISPEASETMTRAGGGRRLDASTYSRAIAQKLLVDLSYASSALEGNTYSYLDTQVLIDFGQAAEGKAAEETQMILNHKEAISYLVDNIADLGIDVREVRTLHALLSRGLLKPSAVGGVRQRVVDIIGSSYTPLAIPALLEDQLDKIVHKANLIDDPFEQSLFLMTLVSYLQFFEDVNKRTGRLLCNVPLLKSGLAPLSFLEMDKNRYVKGLLAVYELSRTDLLMEAYVDAYVSSAKRYDAYAGRDRKVLETEVRHRSLIYQLVKAHVAATVEARAPLDAYGHALEALDGGSAGLAPEVREAVAQRVTEIVEALNEGNHIAYGIPRKLFEDYAQVMCVSVPQP